MSLSVIPPHSSLVLDVRSSILASIVKPLERRGEMKFYAHVKREIDAWEYVHMTNRERERERMVVNSIPGVSVSMSINSFNNIF